MVYPLISAAELKWNTATWRSHFQSTAITGYRNSTIGIVVYVIQAEEQPQWLLLVTQRLNFRGRRTTLLDVPVPAG